MEFTILLQIEALAVVSIAALLVVMLKWLGVGAPLAPVAYDMEDARGLPLRML